MACAFILEHIIREQTEIKFFFTSVSEVFLLSNYEKCQHTVHTLELVMVKSLIPSRTYTQDNLEVKKSFGPLQKSLAMPPYVVCPQKKTTSI
jgi:hypothetical protein